MGLEPSISRYLREWSYRFNRRNLSDLDRYLIRRAVECAGVNVLVEIMVTFC